MTTTPPARLRLTTVADDTVRIELIGDLDYDNADQLLAAVTTQLSLHPHLGHLCLDCGGLGTVDSMGLSILLMVRREADAAGVRLHLDHRGARLDRLLTVTGTFDHLTGAAADADTPGAEEPTMTSGEGASTRTARPDPAT